MSSLTDSILNQYPGAYDHLDPADIEKAVATQYPGAYDHLMEHIDPQTKEVAQDNNKPLPAALKFFADQYQKDPSKDTSILPDIKQPETWTGGFLKSLYDQYVKPLGTVKNMAEGVAGLAAGGMHDVPSSPTMQPSDIIAKQFEAARGAKADLPPDFTAVGDESQYLNPRINSPVNLPAIDVRQNPAVINDPNYFRLSARDIYPSEINPRQGLMSETGELGSGGAPPAKTGYRLTSEGQLKDIPPKGGKTEDYQQAEQFFKDNGGDGVPSSVAKKATDIEHDEQSGTWIPKDNTGRQVGPAMNDKGELPFGAEEGKYGEEKTPFLDNVANKVGANARSVLGLHIPGTALSFHGMNELMRDTLFGGNMITAPKRAFEDLQMLVNPGKAQSMLENIPMQKMADMVNKGGVQMDISDVDVPSLFKGSNPLTKAYNWATDPKPLFKQVIPAMKVKTYDKYFQQMKNAGLSDNEAHQVTGDFVNNIFGGVTPTKLAGDPTFQKLSRIFTLAPDWMTSNFRLGKGMLNSLTNPLDPRNRAYVNGMTNFAGAYSAANVLNYMNTGHFMWQNEPGKELSIAMGSVDRPGGKKATRYLEPFGTAMDMIRLPVAVAHSALSGDPGSSFKLIGNMARNRLSPPISFGADMMFNQDYAGNPLYGKSRFGRHTIGYGEEAQNIGSDFLSHILPMGADAAMDYARGKIGPEEAASKFFQVPPMSYKRPDKGYRNQ